MALEKNPSFLLSPVI